MSPYGFIYVKHNKDFTISLLVDVGSELYYGILEVYTELPEPRPRRGPSFISAVAAEAARLVVDMYNNMKTEGSGERIVLSYENMKADLKNMCKVTDKKKAPSAIRLSEIRSGVEAICSSPIYVSLEDVLSDLPMLAAGAVRGVSKALRPICYTDPLVVVIAESSLGTTIVTSGMEEANISEEMFMA
ncbi:hypothetical protein IPA_03330 [Ignicoccus pacificus DSM 13166]|uniref:Uncharacterized protein n=1 Tax=Ignicoccus pacificus DSM 13166 TaxID=940294 RepID=A0A977KCF1_9CREN|nr:hypothetical protein IPA_03330 [Ignicoccus pacificus DSM 13166]